MFSAVVACEQALLFGRVKRVSREHASELASLAQIGELARRLALLILVIPQVLFRSLQSPLENTRLVHFRKIILNGNTKYIYNKRCHAHFLSLVACGFEKRKMQLDTSSPIHDVPCKTSDCVLPECINSKMQTMKSNLDFKEANNQPFK